MTKKATFKIASRMDKAGIERAIGSIQKRGVQLDKDIQLTAESIIAHVDAHGEVSLFKKLYDAMPAGSRRNALVAWALAFSKVAVNFDKETKKERPFICDKTKTTDLDKAANTPWFSFKKEKAPSEEFSLDKALANFQELLRKQVKAGKLAADDTRLAAVLEIKVETKEAATLGEVVGK